MGGDTHCKDPEEGNSGAARALVTEVKLAVVGSPGRVAHPPKMKTSRFSPPYFRGTPLGPKLGPLEARTGPHGAGNCPF